MEWMGSHQLVLYRKGYHHRRRRHRRRSIHQAAYFVSKDARLFVAAWVIPSGRRESMATASMQRIRKL